MMGKLSAFDKGYMAYDSGMLEDDNPYHPNSANYLEWLKGYQQASIDYGEEYYPEDDDMP